MPQDLKSLDDEALDELADAVARELSRRKNKRARQAVKKARELLAFAGYEADLRPLSDSPVAAKPVKEAKPKLPPIPAGVYRDPESGAEWQPGNRGRQPRWIREALEAGLDLSAYRVDDEAEPEPDELEES